MLKAFRSFRERKDLTSIQLYDFDSASAGLSLRTEDQFTLEIICANPDHPNADLAKAGPQSHSSEECIPQVSDVSSMTTQSDATSEGMKGGTSSDSSESVSIVHTQTSQTTRTRRLQTPPSFLESLGDFAGGMCGMVPLDENASVAEQANCINSLFFANDEIKTTGFCAETTTSHNGGLGVISTASSQHYSHNDDEGDDDIGMHATKGIDTIEKSVLAPILFGKTRSLRKRTFLLKLFRERRARRQETTLLQSRGQR